uniref:Exportin-4 n=1 Tax=Angiostrongylus cantonensis TaxID=6313 RepID=A0A0K0DQ70_ANGCA
GPPNLVSAESRREAEQLFHSIKQELTIEAAAQVIRCTRNQCVLFQIAQMTGEIVLRDWVFLSKEQIIHTYKMLLEFVAETEDLSNYARTAFLRSVAMILKRGIIDEKTGDEEDVFGIIHNLLISQNGRMQAIGGELISAITHQFSSSWRNAKFSITWDFHLRAKSKFENTGLRHLLEMSLKTLHTLVLQSSILPDEFARRICEKFLEVLIATNSFRPPASWKDLLENDEFFGLFFQLHAKIRTDEALSLRTLSCLVQLAGLSGDVLSSSDFTKHYMKLYINSLLDLFAEGPLPHEVNHFCTIVNRLFQYRPIQMIMQIGPDLRERFLTYLSRYIEHLTKQAMYKAIVSSALVIFND